MSETCVKISYLHINIYIYSNWSKAFLYLRQLSGDVKPFDTLTTQTDFSTCTL